ncbi:MAG: thioredoxin family protein [Actinobacteria bacterium]|nr:thioredoxin family protein [Actinomycetota bacterium]
MQVTIQYFDACPHWRLADERLRTLAVEIGFELSHEVIDTPEAAEDAGFRGSPTILVDGVDPFAEGDEPVGLSCRIYDTPEGPAGAPTVEQLREVLT